MFLALNFNFLSKKNNGELLEFSKLTTLFASTIRTVAGNELVPYKLSIALLF